MSNKPTFWAPKISSELALKGKLGVAVIQSLLQGYGVEFDEDKESAVNQQIGSPQTWQELTKKAEPLGFELELLTVPPDLLFSANSVFPVLVAGCASLTMGSAVETESEAEALEKFMVIWNKVGPFFQVMDSQLGRRWLRETDLKAVLAAETVTLSPSLSQEVLNSESFKQLLRSRLHDLGVDAAAADLLLNDSRDLVLLDAVLRMVLGMVQEKVIDREQNVLNLIRALLKSNTTDPALISPAYWSIDLLSKATANESHSIKLRAVTALRIEAWHDEKFHETIAVITDKGSQSVFESVEKEPPVSASDSSTFDVRKFLFADGMLPLSMWSGIIIMAATGIFFQAILFRSMMNLITNFTSLSQRLWLVGLISAFIITILFFQWFIEQIGYSMGQRLNSRLRLALLSMLPNLSSHYFRDTSPAEMIDRIHSGRNAESLPVLLQFTLLGLFQIFFIVIGLAWIDLLSGLLAIFMVFALMLGMASRMLLEDKVVEVLDIRATLSQFYRDTMQGLVAIRTHSAEQAARREYEATLLTWGKKALDLYTTEMWFWAYDGVVTYILISLIIVFYAFRTDNPSNLLLLAYWCINIDQIARNQLALVVVGAIFSFINLKRYGSILEVPTEKDLIAGLSARSQDDRLEDEDLSVSKSKPAKEHGMAIAIRQVCVLVSEHVLLKNISLDIPAGSHIAVVGTSGAGKSTLIGLLLGWHYPDSGQLLIDNQPLSYERLLQLRQETAWVDPSIQLWNRSLLYNLYYADQQVPLNIVVKQADLQGVLERLEDGLQTSLGSEGRSLSGGQGQRVRFGRALQRKDARLVILDEAFRGLDRGKRRKLLTRARQFWSHSTLICVTHDVGQTLDFERVLVIDKGEVIEDGNPLTLAKQAESRYAALLAAEENVQDKLWSKHNWRRLWLEGGQFADKSHDRNIKET